MLLREERERESSRLSVHFFFFKKNLQKSNRSGGGGPKGGKPAKITKKVCLSVVDPIASLSLPQCPSTKPPKTPAFYCKSIFFSFMSSCPLGVIFSKVVMLGIATAKCQNPQPPPPPPPPPTQKTSPPPPPPPKKKSFLFFFFWG